MGSTDPLGEGDAPPEVVKLATPTQPLPLMAQAKLVVEEKPTLAKAIIAGVTTFAAGYATATADGSITSTEWVTLAAGTVVAALAVWATTNKP